MCLMKIKFRIIVVIQFFLSSLILNAQEMRVKLEHDITDLSASIHTRYDGNNEPCALLRIRLATSNAVFKGNIVGNVRHEYGEYLVYMSPNSKWIRISADGFFPLDINFPKYDINGLQGKQTYTLTLTKVSDAKYLSQNDENAYLTLNVSPANADVLIDDIPQKLDNNGILITKLAQGDHICTVSASGYITQSSEFVMGTANISQSINLVSEMAFLQVSCSSKGVEVYINDVLQGTSPWNGSLLPGDYWVEVRTQNLIQGMTAKQSRKISLKAGDNEKIEFIPFHIPTSSF